MIGATGKQGGSVARELLRRGRPVRALTRDPRSPASLALADLGATVVRGDLDDPYSLASALDDVHGVYSVQTFMGDGGAVAEERQGRAVATAAAKAGIGHFVYGSVGGADRSRGVAHFASKGRIEHYIDELGLPATVLRLPFFLSNFAFMGPRRDGDGLVLRLALRPQTRLQMFDPSDTGLFAAEAFDDPVTYLGRRIELASDELTGDQMAAVFETESGLPTRFQEQSTEDVRRFSEDTAAMFEWFNTEGFRADLTDLRARHPELTTLQTWAQRHWRTPAE